MSDIVYKNIDIISKTQKLDKKFIIDHISIINPCKLKINNKLDNNIKNKIFMSTQDEKYIFLISKKNINIFITDTPLDGLRALIHRQMQVQTPRVQTPRCIEA